MKKRVYITKEKLCKLIIKEIHKLSKDLKNLHQIRLPIPIKTILEKDGESMYSIITIGGVKYYSFFPYSGIIEIVSTSLEKSGIRGEMIYNDKGEFQSIALYGNSVIEFRRLAHFIKKNKLIEINPNELYTKDVKKGFKEYFCYNGKACQEAYEKCKILNREKKDWGVKIVDGLDNSKEEIHKLFVYSL